MPASSFIVLSLLVFICVQNPRKRIHMHTNLPKSTSRLSVCTCKAPAAYNGGKRSYKTWLFKLFQFLVVDQSPLKLKCVHKIYKSHTSYILTMLLDVDGCVQIETQVRRGELEWEENVGERYETYGQLQSQISIKEKWWVKGSVGHSFKCAYHTLDHTCVFVHIRVCKWVLVPLACACLCMCTHM